MQKFFSVNPKVALDQVLNSYAKWIDHNLNDCDAPWKGTNKRNHLVCTITEKLRYVILSFKKNQNRIFQLKRIQRWRSFLLIKFCRFVDDNRKFCNGIFK